MKLSLIGIGLLCAALAFIINFHAVDAWTQTFVGDIHSMGKINPSSDIGSGEYFSAVRPGNTSGYITYGDNANLDIGDGSESKPGLGATSWVEETSWVGVDPTIYEPDALIDKLEEYRDTLTIRDTYTGTKYITNDADHFPSNRIVPSFFESNQSGVYTFDDIRILDDITVKTDKTFYFVVNTRLEINEYDTNPAIKIVVEENATLVVVGQESMGSVYFIGDSQIDIRPGGTLILASKANNILRVNSQVDSSKSLGIHVNEGGLAAFIAHNTIRHETDSLSTIYNDCSETQIEQCDARGIFVAKDIIIQKAKSDRNLGGIFYATNNITLEDDDDSNIQTSIYYEPSLLIDMPPIGKHLFYRTGSDSVLYSGVAP